MLGVGAFGGRVFTSDDDKPGAPPVAVPSHRVWQISYASDASVVGSTFVIEGHPFTVIGVAPPGFFGETLRSDPPDLWIPVYYKQELMKRVELRSHFVGGIMLVTGAPPGALEPLLRRALAEVDPNLTITSVRTMQQQIELSFDQERAVASLAGLFGIVALLLAAVGLYGGWNPSASAAQTWPKEATQQLAAGPLTCFVFYNIKAITLSY